MLKISYSTGGTQMAESQAAGVSRIIRKAGAERVSAEATEQFREYLEDVRQRTRRRSNRNGKARGPQDGQS